MWLQETHLNKACITSRQSFAPALQPYCVVPVSKVTSGEGNGTPFQYSCLEKPMDRGPGGPQSMGLLRVRHD